MAIYRQEWAAVPSVDTTARARVMVVGEYVGLRRGDNFRDNPVTRAESTCPLVTQLRLWVAPLCAEGNDQW